MSTETLLVILLVWSVAGLLAAIAFGKAIQETSADEEDGLASSAGTLKYFRKNKENVRETSAQSSQHSAAKRASN